MGAEQVLAGVPLQGPPALHCYLEPRLAPGYIGWFAHDGTEAHVGVAGYPERFRPVAALGALVDRVAQQLDLSGAEPTEFRAGVIPVGGVLARIATGGAVLVGDAAGAVSPLTAGGLDPAIRLSAFAADLIDELSVLVAPVADGSVGTPTLFDVDNARSPSRKLKLLAIDKRPGGIVWLRYGRGR